MIENRLNVLMKEKKLTKRDIICITGMSYKTFNNFYYGKTKIITNRTLNNLCFALNCTMNDLLEYKPDEI